MISKINSKRRKIYYVPGFISLLCLPIILLKIQPSNKKFTVINYLTPSDRKDPPNIITFSGEYFIKWVSTKKIIPFYLNEDYELNKVKLNIIELEALKLKFTCDTNRILAVHFSDSIYYGEFVSLITMMHKHKFKRYGEWKNTIYIFGEAPPDPNEIKPIYL